MLTVFRRLTTGPTLHRGKSAPYRGLVEAAGEPHVVRTELTGPISGEVRARRGSLLVLAHLSDLHVTDVESPARFEFLNRYAGDSRFRELLTMQRPQESLNAQAISAMVRAVNAIGEAPVTGSPVDLVAMTGDAVDNAQSNELANFIALLDGGVVKPSSGGPDIECVQSPGWHDDLFWKPDGDAHGRDQFRVKYGFPQYPGLLDRALRSFDAPGLEPPWIGCHGNHEELCQGVGIVTPEMADAMAGGQKPVALGKGFNPSTALELFVQRPQAFMAGPSVAVTPDAARRPFGLRRFVESHFRGAGRPDGHGFGAANRRDATAYYVHDTRAVRLVTLDTACPAGGADGCIDRTQVAWLEERLAEVHATYIGADGDTVRTGNENRLAVILSHHPLFTIHNHRAADGVAAEDLRRLLHRFPNVVLWLNGHVHMNLVQPRANRSGIAVGFWEVTTSSLVDWPCQGRLVELFDAGGGRLGIACTMIDHDGLADPGPAVAPEELAGLHRQLAANDPMGGASSPRAGGEGDRNVVLMLPAPFPLPR